MILSGGGQDMVQPSSGGGGVFQRLLGVLSRNQQLGQMHRMRLDEITHGAEETTRAMNERHTNATTQLTNLMGLASLKHPAGHPQAGQLVHPELAHHINEAGVQGAFGFKFGSQYKPFQKPPTQNTSTTQPTVVPVKNSRKKK
jgi:hypothetical protein